MDDPSESEFPEWERDYLNRLAGRIVHSYDLEKNKHIRGFDFTLYASFEAQRHKQLFHPAISYAEHNLYEYLFVNEYDTVTIETVDQLIDLGHELADDWIDADDDHYATEFSFGLIVPSIPDDIRQYVSRIDERTMLRYGFDGHYDIHIIVVAPEEQSIVATDRAEIQAAFIEWDTQSRSTGIFSSLLDQLR